MPLLAMVYLRGPRIAHPDDPALLAHAAILASDLGADLVKIPFARSSAEMADVVASCPIPVLAAGGSRLADEADLLAYVQDVNRSGAAGMAIGRNLFERSDVSRVTAHVAAILHGSPASRSALVGGAALWAARAARWLRLLAPGSPARGCAGWICGGRALTAAPS
jgi:2-amino-4,5-dihydroxy-6-oxo-7-(phosphonooxy)heptanoate synthase